MPHTVRTWYERESTRRALPAATAARPFKPRPGAARGRCVSTLKTGGRRSAVGVGPDAERRLESQLSRPAVPTGRTRQWVPHVNIKLLSSMLSLHTCNCFRGHLFARPVS